MTTHEELRCANPECSLERNRHSLSCHFTGRVICPRFVAAEPRTEVRPRVAIPADDELYGTKCDACLHPWHHGPCEVEGCGCAVFGERPMNWHPLARPSAEAQPPLEPDDQHPPCPCGCGLSAAYHQAMRADLHRPVTKTMLAATQPEGACEQHKDGQHGWYTYNGPGGTQLVQCWYCKIQGVVLPAAVVGEQKALVGEWAVEAAALRRQAAASNDSDPEQARTALGQMVAARTLDRCANALLAALKEGADRVNPTEALER